MNCKAALDLLFDFLDGELEGVTNDEVAEHLAKCRNCYPYFNFQRLFLDRLAASTDASPVSPELARRIRELLDDEATS